MARDIGTWIETGRGAPIVMGVLLLGAAANAFVLDDAFISFRYAENLVRSGELTWNPGSGEPVEGYTNFLWTLLLALPIAAGLDPVWPAQLFGWLAFAGTLVATFQLGRVLFGSRARALLPVVLLGTHYSASAYATGGLETSLQTCLLATAAWLACHTVEQSRWSAARLATLSLCAGAALLTRLDSAVPLAVLAGSVAASALSRAPRPLRLPVFTVASLLPALALVVPWFVWKHHYYGALLPNTFAAKTGGGPASWAQGFAYLGEFLQSYHLAPVLLVLACLARWPHPHRPFVTLAAGVTAWLGYLVAVGGDFMEFRLLVPILPWFFLLLTAWLLTLEDPRTRGALLAIVVLGSLAHGVRFAGGSGVASITQLRDNIESPARDWGGIGRSLGTLFGEAPRPVRIAVTAAGAIPYYSRLPTVDMHGLSDPWIAPEGLVVSVRPGHQRQPPLGYLLDRGVNLVIGHPRLEAAGSERSLGRQDLGRFRIASLEPPALPAGARLLELPVGEGHSLTALYLVPTEAVDARIRELDLVTYAPWAGEPRGERR